MISFLISFLVVVVILGLIYYVVTQIPLPPHLARIAQVVIVVVGGLILILMLLGLIGYAPAPYPLR